MKATEILMEEHRLIERVLDALAAAASRLAAGRPMSPVFFLAAADFVRNFADGCHHHKEEGVLFAALNANGLPKDSGPVAVMLAEHEEGRRLTRAMREGAEQMQADPSASSRTASSALAYVALLRQHIRKEDDVLFPMANQCIPRLQHAQISAAFEQIGMEEARNGIGDKHRALVAELEKAAAEAGQGE